MNRTLLNNRSTYCQFAAIFFPIFFPIAVRNITNSLVSIVDVLMLGRLDDVALSGASFANQFSLIVSLTLSGLTSGASVMIAQYWGRKDKNTIERIVAIALRFSFSIVAVFFMLSSFFPRRLMSFYTNDTEIIDAGVTYLRYICPSFFILAFTDVYFTSMSAMGHVVVATVSKTSAVFTNLLLNWLLIYGKCGFPALGLRGAAIATVCARAVELTIAFVHAAHNTQIRIRLRYVFQSQGVLIQDFLRLCIPVTVNDIIWVAGYNVTGSIVGHLGVSVTAAYSVACQVREFMLVFSYGTASSAAIIIGNALGSGELDLAMDYGKKLITIGTAIGIGAGLAVFGSQNLVAGIVQLPPKATEYLHYLLQIMTVFTMLQAFTTLINLGLFRAGGDPKFALYLDFVTMWGINVGMGMLSAYVLHLPVRVTLILIMLDEAVKAPVLYWRFRKNIWVRNITRSELKNCNEGSETAELLP